MESGWLFALLVLMAFISAVTSPLALVMATGAVPARRASARELPTPLALRAGGSVRGRSDVQAEVGAEDGKVGTIDKAVAVDVEGRQVVRVARPGAEGGTEQGEVGAVHEPVP